MTAYQIRSFKRAARINARYLCRQPRSLDAWFNALDAALDAFNIGSVASPEYRRLIQAIERSADLIIERAA